MGNHLWEELNFEINMCKVLKKNDNDQKVISGGGNKKSNILILGDDPNLFEDENLRTAPNSSGAFFENLYNLVGLEKENFFLSNIVKCSLKMKDLSKEELDKYREILDMQIAIQNPKYIIALGQEVVRFLFNNDEMKITEVRGKKIRWEGDIEVYPLYDPSFLIRSKDKKRGSPKWLTWKDLEKIVEEVKGS